MTLLKAMRNGSLFKRNHWSEWLTLDTEGFLCWNDNSGEAWVPNVDDLDAGDWEVRKAKHEKRNN